MIDLRAARADPDAFRSALVRKGEEAATLFDELIAADARWLELIPRVDALRTRTKLKGKPTPEQLEELKEVKPELKRLEDDLAEAERRRRELLDQVPNPPDVSVPDGLAEEDAVEIRRVGEPPSFDFPAQDHVDLAQAYGWFDLERAARVSGSRFVYRMGDVALLELALYRFALDRLGQKGFVPVLPPVLVREEAMYGTGFFPTDEVNIYAVERDGLYLVGTSEVSLAALHMGEILEADSLPIRYAGYSTCFRREAGAAGKDTRGMFRVHQFDKVEMFVFTYPEESRDEHERLLEIEEELVQELGLPYRVMNMAAGDLGASAAKKYDIEAWFPGTGAVARDHLDVEHDRLSGTPSRDPPSAGRREPGDRPHPQWDCGDRASDDRADGELPGRGRLDRRAGAAVGLRRPRAPRTGEDQGLRRATIRGGGVPERSNGAVLKTVGRASASWVRIPPPPLLAGRFSQILSRPATRCGARVRSRNGSSSAARAACVGYAAASGIASSRPSARRAPPFFSFSSRGETGLSSVHEGLGSGASSSSRSNLVGCAAAAPRITETNLSVRTLAQRTPESGRSRRAQSRLPRSDFEILRSCSDRSASSRGPTPIQTWPSPAAAADEGVPMIYSPTRCRGGGEAGMDEIVVSGHGRAARRQRVHAPRVACRARYGPGRKGAASVVRQCRSRRPPGAPGLDQRRSEHRVDVAVIACDEDSHFGGSFSIGRMLTSVTSALRGRVRAARTTWTTSPGRMRNSGQYGLSSCSWTISCIGVSVLPA